MGEVVTLKSSTDFSWAMKGLGKPLSLDTSIFVMVEVPFGH